MRPLRTIALAAGLVLAAGCSTDTTTYDDDVIDSTTTGEGVFDSTPDSVQEADQVLDGTEDGVQQENVDNPPESTDE